MSLRRGCWLPLLIVSLGTLVVVALLNQSPRLFADLYLFANEFPWLIVVHLALLVLFLLPFLLAFWEGNPGRSAHSSEELSGLLERKRLGLLQRAARRLRPRPACGDRSPSMSHSEHVTTQPAAPSPMAEMDRLVQQKRKGAWSPSPPDHTNVVV